MESKIVHTSKIESLWGYNFRFGYGMVTGLTQTFGESVHRNFDTSFSCMDHKLSSSFTPVNEK